MQTLFDLISSGYELKTCGTNSIILKKDDCAYKLTREFLCEQVEDIVNMNRMLGQKGVLVAQLYGYEPVKFHSVAGFAKVLGGIMEAGRLGDIWQASRIDDLQNAEDEKCYVVPMLKYDFIEGDNIFSDKRLSGINLVGINKKLSESSSLHPRIKDILMHDLEENLRFGEALLPEEIYKFFEDGKTILKCGLSIDNHTGDNFVYGKTKDGRKGIFYIDLGGFENMAKYNRLGETNLFRFTIDNLCKMIFVNTNADLVDVRKRQLKLLDKYAMVLQQFLKDNPDCLEQYVSYVSQANYLDKLKQSLQPAFKESEKE